jgi:perosamine synthetase
MDSMRRGDDEGCAVERFEREFAARLGVRHAVAVSSVRYGLYQVLQRLRLPADAEVLCSPLTVYPVVEAIGVAGFRPVFVDYLPESFSPDLSWAERRLTPRSRVFLLTHLWGAPAEADRVAEFCRQHDLILVEDASQTLNAAIHGKKIGTFGRAGLFSLSLTKTVDTLRGAILATDDDDLAAEVRGNGATLPRAPVSFWLPFLAVAVVADLLTSPRFFWLTGPLIWLWQRLGGQDFLDHRRLRRADRLRKVPASWRVAFGEAQARLGLRQLEGLDAADARRRAIAERYDAAFRDLAEVVRPPLPPGGRGNYWMYAVQVRDRARFRRDLWRIGRIDSAVPSMDACHRMPYFAENMDRLPEASRLLDQALYLPAYDRLSEEQIESVIQAVRQAATSFPDLQPTRRPPDLRRMYRPLLEPRLLSVAAVDLWAFYRSRPPSAPPVGLAWELTYACDCRCPNCASESLAAQFPSPSREVSLAIAQAIGEAGVPMVNLSGGEPLLSEHFLPAAAVLSSYRVRVHVSTNGSRLADLAGELRAVGIDTVTISLDSVAPERHDQMRRHPGLYQKVLRGIDALRRQPGKIPRIRLRFLIRPDNCNELAEFASRWKEIVDEVCFQPVQRLGEGDTYNFEDESVGFRPEHEAALSRAVVALMREHPQFDRPYYRWLPTAIFHPDEAAGRFRCLVPALACRVRPNGQIIACTVQAEPAGSILETPLQNLWRSQAFQELRRSCLEGTRTCQCWAQPVQVSFLVPPWIERFGISARRRAGIKS